MANRLDGSRCIGLTWRAGSLGPDHSVLDRGPGPPPPKVHSPLQLSAHICRGEMARWIKMSMGRKVDLDSSDIVLDGNPPPPPPKRGRPPNFRPCLLSPKGCMDQDATWCGGRPRPRTHCARWGPNTSLQKGTKPPVFGPCLLRPDD